MSTEALRKQFEAWLIERGWTENHREKTAAGAYWRADLRWMEEAYQAGHAAGVNKMVAAEVGEPVAWGWVDTMIGEGHRLMMVKINPIS